MTSILIPSDELLPLFGDDGENWIQGKWSDGADICLHEGIKRCVAKQPGDFHLIEQVAKAEGWSTTWNDRDGREWPEVKAKIFEIAEITPDRLEAVFGPQWAEVVAIVRRAATLTHEEAKTLAASWDASRAASWDASAVSIRDLVGQHGFTQEHYDTLTGPWRRVIGPVHADDAELESTDA